MLTRQQMIDLKLGHGLTLERATWEEDLREAYKTDKAKYYTMIKDQPQWAPVTYNYVYMLRMWKAD